MAIPSPFPRRRFLQTVAAGASVSLLPSRAILRAADQPAFSISLAQWSLHKAIFAGEMDNRDFAEFAKKEFGIDAVEYVNQFFMDKVQDQNYLKELRQRGEDAGVKSLLIMCDRLGDVGHPEEAERIKTVENHKPWLEAAKFLGCHSLRVNAGSRGSREEQEKLAADGLRRLSEVAKPLDLNVIVENHGGFSSDGAWLAAVMKRVDLENCGTLPDFGNFRVSDDTWYDRYQGVKELMPYAKAVSAKSHDFNEAGDETHTDYKKMMEIVLAAGYRGYVGIEYEGSKLSEVEGIRATQKLLERVRSALQA
ncbi:MAG TPA: sugar phosphate isomerase/epimerase family protein [Verrucomicrobiales bacterium]|nr:sugar phosphate isomerase/epimerase family protein [Verrucomicrobiales bacterium]